MVHTRVFFRTILKVDPFRTLVKLSSPQNPFLRPALLTSLIEVRKTSKIGKSIKIVIRRILGSSHRYGSTAARGFFFFIFTPPNHLLKRIGSRSLMFRLPVKSYLNLGSACNISLKIIKQCLNIVAKKCVLFNFDNALFYICPFSLGCRVEVTALENVDPG